MPRPSCALDDALARALAERAGDRPAAAAPRVHPELAEERLGPAVAVERLDARGHRLQPCVAAPRGSVSSASRKRSAVSATFHGLTSTAPGSTCAAPANSESSRTPFQRRWQTGLALAQGELLRHEVHPVAQRGDHGDVGAPVERDEPGARDAAVQVLDGRHAGPAVSAVDAGDEQLDLVALGPVLLAVEPRRHEHLQHRRRARALGLELEQPLERAQLVLDPLRVVETLDAEHELTVAELLLELLERRRGLRLRRASAGTPRRRSRSDRRRCRRGARPPRSRRAETRARARADRPSGSAVRPRPSGS